MVKASYRDLLAKLRSGEIDLMLSGLHAAAFADDFLQEYLFEEDLFVVAAHDHPLADLPLDGGALAPYPWVVPPVGSTLHTVWEDMFDGTRRPDRQIQCSSASTTMGLLLSGNWLAVLSPGQFKLE